MITNIYASNSFELTELSSINKVSLVQVSFCSNTESVRDDLSWTLQSPIEYRRTVLVWIVQISKYNFFSFTVQYQAKLTKLISYWSSTKHHKKQQGIFVSLSFLDYGCFALSIYAVMLKLLSNTQLIISRSLQVYRTRPLDNTARLPKFSSRQQNNLDTRNLWWCVIEICSINPFLYLKILYIICVMLTSLVYRT